MHDVVRDVLADVIRDGGPGRADRLLDAALEASGLAGDDYGSDFRQIAVEQDRLGWRHFLVELTEEAGQHLLLGHVG
ncbi:hypothetical protein LTR94_037566, partial [Friedmanniomyces endolithicus]